MPAAEREVSFGPTTEVADSFDYLVGLPEQRRRAGKQFNASLSFTDCLIKADRAQYERQNSHERPT